MQWDIEQVQFVYCVKGDYRLQFSRRRYASRKKEPYKPGPIVTVRPGCVRRFVVVVSTLLLLSTLLLTFDNGSIVALRVRRHMLLFWGSVYAYRVVRTGACAPVRVSGWVYARGGRRQVARGSRVVVCK